MKQVTTFRTCDIDAETPATEVRFGFGGKAYTIDLCEECKTAFKLYVSHAQLVKETMRERRKATTE